MPLIGVQLLEKRTARGKVQWRASRREIGPSIQLLKISEADADGMGRGERVRRNRVDGKVKRRSIRPASRLR